MQACSARWPLRITRWGKNEALTEEAKDSVFKDGVGEWDNAMAAGMMPLDQEEAAFGDVMPLTPGSNGNNHRY